MTKFNDLKCVRDLLSLGADYDRLLSLLDSDNLENAARRIRSLLKVESSLNSLKEEICSLTGTNSIGNAKSKISSLCRRNPQQAVAALYNLDCSFLEKPSPAWTIELTISSKDDWEKAAQQWAERIEKRRTNCVRWYNDYLQNVKNLCEEENLTNAQTKEHILNAHDDFREDYLNEDFQTVYATHGEGTVTLKRLNENVKLIECLPFVEEYAPAQLLADVKAESRHLGEISKDRFDEWESSFTLAQQSSPREKETTLRSLTRTIFGGMIWRVINIDPAGWPNANDGTSLKLLLSTTEEDPASAEWNVNDLTTLFECASRLKTLSGTTPEGFE